MKISRRTMIASAGAAALVAAPLAAKATTTRLSSKVELFGHRGACALRPEHTLASYALAIEAGADYIEPDLCITKDGVLVARHENNMAETTDVALRPEFAARKTTKIVDGQTVTGWFTEDFTLAELKTLRAIERIPKIRPQNTRYDGEFQIPTFYEMIDFIAAESATRGRLIGIVPEIKHSTYFAGVGLPMEDRFLKILADHSYMKRAPVEIQSFEVANLKYLRTKLGRPDNIRLMQLVGDGDTMPADVVAAKGALTWRQMTSPEGLRDMKAYADVVAPQVRGVIPLGPDGRLGAPTALVPDAHKAGLLVHIWTFRPENMFLAGDFKDGGDANARNPAGSIAEMKRYIAAGVDGFFTDDPGLGRQAIAESGG